MSAFVVGVIMGGLGGFIAGLVFVWVRDWWDMRPRPVDFDSTIQRIRNL